MSEPDVIIRTERRAGRITLNRPRALNALTTGMCVAIGEALLAWRDDAAVAAVVIDHAGERGFCAGGDIRMMAASGAGDGSEARRFFAAEYRMNELLQRFPKPVIAVMDGVTMGGGVGLSMPARFRIATERTVWAMPEADIGLFPDVGMGWHLPRLAGRTGVWLALTGARLKAADCLAARLATHYVPSAKVGQLLADLLAGASKSHLMTLTADPGPSALEAQRPQIDALFAAASPALIIAALEADGSEWALAQRQALAGKCPATLEVSMRLLRNGRRRLTFADEMAEEYRVAVRMIHRHDFIEGVRAVIVDKDNAPRWDPPGLDGVTEDLLDVIFSDLPPDEAWTPYP